MTDKELGKNGTLLSLIIPAYNKESTIENTIIRSVEYLVTQPYGWEIIVIDDASTDATVRRVNQVMAQHPEARFQLLRNESNRQKGGAVKRGILAAAGKYSIVIDADYAYPVTQVSSFLEPLVAGSDVVIGNRTDPRTTYIVRPAFFSYIYQRFVLSRIFNIIVRLFLFKGVRDTQCGMKGLNTATAKAIINKITIFNFAFDVELLHIAQHNGLKIVQVPVTFNYIDEPSSVRLLKDSFIMLRSLFRIKINSLGTKYLIDISGGHPEDGS